MDEHATSGAGDLEAQQADMSSLIESISKVSLSATTEKDVVTLESDDILQTLILSAAVPGGFSKITTCSSSLPPSEMVENVLQTYLQKVHPTRPFIGISALASFRDSAYAGDADESYSQFLIGVIVATTVTLLSPESFPSAVQLYHFSIQRLVVAFQTMVPDTLRELEAVVALACFAEVMPVDNNLRDALGFNALHELLPDLWLLNGLAIRIAVDHGLHQTVRTPRERDLFHTAVAMDKQAAERLSLPVGLPSASIHT